MVGMRINNKATAESQRTFKYHIIA